MVWIRGPVAAEAQQVVAEHAHRRHVARHIELRRLTRARRESEMSGLHGVVADAQQVLAVQQRAGRARHLRRLPRAGSAWRRRSRPAECPLPYSHFAGQARHRSRR